MGRERYRELASLRIFGFGLGEVSCILVDEMMRIALIAQHVGWLIGSWIARLMTNSLAVKIGDEVKCGDFLALVGSSGISAVPHLHFQVEDENGLAFDPYAGPYSQDESYWVQQETTTGFPAERCWGEPEE